MKKLLVLTAIFCLYFQAVTVSAATPDYSGSWELDISKSKFPETVKIDSMSLKVSQTAKDIKVETYTTSKVALGGEVTKSVNASKTIVYNLDGTETTTTLGDGIMAVTESKKAKILADGKLSLTVTRGSKSEANRPATKSNDTWELLDKGQTLKIIRYTESARGGANWEMYFTKKSSNAPTTTGDAINTAAPDASGNIDALNADRPAIPREIKGGVLNGKATSLPVPEYSDAARAVRASGAVSVQVTIDEQGSIISVSAVSGHPLLREAAEEAARNAKFAPTTLSGQPVKVTGVIVYNLTP